MVAGKSRGSFDREEKGNFSVRLLGCGMLVWNC